MTSRSTVRIGFLGAGLIAAFHSKMLRAAGDLVERAGVFDIDAGRAAAFARASGHRVCESVDEVLGGCDAVYVCTWTSEHRALVERAARRGVAVFCEKPLGTSLSDATAMAEAVEASGVVNQVGLVLRHSPAWALARHWVHQPAAGRLMAVVFRDDQFIPTQGHYASNWRADVRRAGAGALLEHSVHDLDMLEHVAGPVESVCAHTSSFHGIDGIEDVANVLLRFANGASGSLVSVWHDNLHRASQRHVELISERRMVTLDGNDYLGPVSHEDGDGSTRTLEGDALVDAAAGILEAGANADVAFVRAVLTGDRAYPGFPFAVRAQSLADACYRSAAEGGSVVAV